MSDQRKNDGTRPFSDEDHFLYKDNAEALAKFEALLAEDQALRAEHLENPDPTKRRLRVACNGCATPFCCNQRVDVNITEALVLYRDAKQHSKKQLEEALRRARESARSKALTDTEFFHRRLPCPFLVRGRCSVYAARPHGCRTHYMASNPLKCRDELAPSETFAMDPDKGITAELVQISEDIDFFNFIEQTEPLELSQALLLVESLLRDPRWTSLRQIP